MRTPKRLDAEERVIYHPALLTCPHCGELLVMWNSLAWDKTIQTLDRVLSIASRPGHCPKATCRGSRLRLLSAEAQRLALPGSTSGYDGLVRLGWLRQHQRATSSEVHADLSSMLAISSSHVRALSQHVSLPLLACHERQQRDRLAQTAKEQGGVLLALDGLAPQGGEPPLGGIRDLATGLTLRRGWLSHQDQPPFEACLAPLRRLEWPILAVRSDTQRGVVPAVATVVPHRLHPFCQAHSLRHLAEPLAEVDAACQVARRQTVREHRGPLLCQEPQAKPGHGGVVTVPGLLPSPVAEPSASASPSPTTPHAPVSCSSKAPAVGTQRLRHTRSLLTLKGRPPFRLAGLETYARLPHGARVRLDLRTQRVAPRLLCLYPGLQAALAPWADAYQEFHHGAAGLRAIASILEPCARQPMRAARVAGPLRGSRDTVQRRPALTPL